MRYIKEFKIFESNTDDYYQDFISILSQLEDDYDLIIETNNEITYYCSDTDGAYDGYSFNIKADPSIEIFNFDKSFTKILEKIERYADSIDHKIVIDPENRSMEYLTIKDFIDSYSGEELTEIDIVIYKYYDDLNESMLHFSPKFRNLIKQISSNKIADSLLKAELTDVKPDMTLIDLGDSPGEITFMQINKAEKKIKDFTPTIDINSPESGTSVETLYWYDMKKKSGSGIASSGIYIDPSRNKTSIGKFANKVFPGKFSQKEIEDFTNLFKSESVEKDNFKIVEGEEIRKWYRPENYQTNKKGTLSGSCMNGGYYVDLYIINPDTIKMVILLEDDKILGRAILWKIDDQEFKYLLDRIYYTEDHIIEKFISYAKKNDWAYKTKQSHSSFEDITFRGEDKNIKIDIKVRNLHKYFPYVDTFQWINIDTRTLYNYYDDDVTHRLESTHGGKTALKAWSKYNNKYLKILDAVWSENRKDYLTRDQAVNHDGDWHLKEDLLYSNWGNYYIVKGDEVKSKKLGSLLDRNRSKEVIMDEEGNKDWLPNRMEYTDFIYYDKEYYHIDLCVMGYNGDYILKSNSTEIRILITNKWGEIPLSKELYESIKYLYEYMGVKIFTTDWESSEISYTDVAEYLYTRMCYIINPFYLVDEIENLSRHDDFKFGKVVKLYQKFKDFLKSDIANRDILKEKKFIYQYFGKESVDRVDIESAILYELGKLYSKFRQIHGFELRKDELVDIMYEICMRSGYQLYNDIYRNYIKYIFPDLGEYEGYDLAESIISNVIPLLRNNKNLEMLCKLI